MAVTVTVVDPPTVPIVDPPMTNRNAQSWTETGPYEMHALSVMLLAFPENPPVKLVPALNRQLMNVSWGFTFGMASVIRLLNVRFPNHATSKLVVVHEGSNVGETLISTTPRNADDEADPERDTQGLNANGSV